MNVLVVYDSVYGNTERIAQIVAGRLAELGDARADLASEVAVESLSSVDLVVVGGPTQGWRATPPIVNFVARIGAQAANRLMWATFDTRYERSVLLTGSAARRLAKQLRRLGAELLVPPESFFVTATEGPLQVGEEERAAAWAAQLHERAAERHPERLGHKVQFA